ncbi:MAG TPA: alpha-E domain-containing protein [Acetobacteraceae bacterium]
MSREVIGGTIAASGHLIARHAGSTIWLARYMERIENLARLLDVTKTFARDDGEGRTWLAILHINGDEHHFFARHRAADAESVAYFYLLDKANPSSVQAVIGWARENARTLRALISTEMWLHINVFRNQITRLDLGDIASDRLSAVCAMLREGTQAHTGITEGTFYRDQCWHFYMLGRHLERADQTTRLLDTRFHAVAAEMASDGAEIDAGQWIALLRAAAGYHAYRREYPHGYRPVEVAGFLLKNGAFPRSVWLNLSQVEWHLSQLRSRYHLRGVARPMERIDRLLAMMASQTVEQIITRGLSPFLDWMQAEVAALHEDIATELCGGA